jgi:hypothetical protein
MGFHNPTLRWPTEPRQSSPPRAAVEKTAVKPPWKTLRVSHFPRHDDDWDHYETEQHLNPVA